MNIKSCLKGLMVLVVVSFAYSADSTANVVSPNQPVVMISSVKSDANTNGLKKQQSILKPTTTWSKIKDLFE